MVGTLAIGAQHAETISELLDTLGVQRALPADLQANAAYWATVMADRMDQRDIQTVVWLLLEVTGDRRAPYAERRSACYWAAYLDDCMAPAGTQVP